MPGQKPEDQYQRSQGQQQAQILGKQLRHLGAALRKSCCVRIHAHRVGRDEGVPVES